MVKYTESQNRIVATGHTVVSFALVLLFIAVFAWGLLKALSFAASAVVPVAAGYFLALFFRPYYHWWEKKVRSRSLALIIMLATVLIPLGLLVWLAGATLVGEVADFFKQVPDLLGRLLGWLDSTFPKLKEMLGQLQVACERIGGLCASALGSAASAGAGAVSTGGDAAAALAHGVAPTANAVLGTLGEGVNTVGAVATNAVETALASGGDVVGAALAHGGDAVGAAVSGAMQGAGETLAGVALPQGADLVPAVSNSAHAGAGVVRAGYDKVAELYANYGDAVKKVGMDLYQMGVVRMGVAGGSGGAPAAAAATSSAAASGASSLVAGYDRLVEAFTNLKGPLQFAGAGLMGVLRVVFHVLVTAIFFVAFLVSGNRRGGKVSEYVPALKDSTRNYLAKQAGVLVEIMVSFFQRQVSICLVEACYYGIGFWLVGLPWGFLIGFALGMLNLIPLFGSLVCMPIALTAANFGAGGSPVRVVLVLVVWVVGLILDGYFITPKIQGDKTGLGYAGVIFSFLFWPMVLGPMMGLLLAIPLSACCVVVWRGVCDLTRNAKVL